ncbi:hypothetical protein STRIC_0531 [Streptococcus ictaluri 707-05]|uniref:Uncharacterized protein n=1 Tax=Streptococcus ictaluri 707-05 TaxID=764299 RepID=G5K644_9STRE|nr:hypothetical protein STRIC_0531 [Streptococcus ictaluri 707-05]
MILKMIKTRQVRMTSPLLVRLIKDFLKRSWDTLPDFFLL